MSHITYVTIHRYLPQGVKQIVGEGGGSWIGQVDETTVLKYPHTDAEMKWVQTEAKIHKVLGHHPRIIQSKGITKDGLLLEFTPNGNLYDYLTAHPEASLERRLSWCMQATEALIYIHSKRVLHCDLRHDNLLLDANLDLKLADFQGQHFSADGEVLLDGLSVESTKAHLPRKPPNHSSIRTDLFALGSAIYFIMVGHEVFPDLDNSKDEEEIERRFRAGDFPTDPHICATIVEKCWKQLYSSAQQVSADLESVQAAIARGEPLNSVAKYVNSAPEKDILGPATSWLSGLCDEKQMHKVPPSYRQLVGFD